MRAPQRFLVILHTLLYLLPFLLHTVINIALQRKSHLCSSFLGIARPQSQFIYFQDRITYFLQQHRQIDCGNIKFAHRHMMWKLRLWPCNSFFGNICLNFRHWFFAVCMALRSNLEINANGAMNNLNPECCYCSFLQGRKDCSQHT